MIYIIRGSDKAAKNLISCSIAEYLTALPVDVFGYTITPDRNNTSETKDIYKIEKDGQIIYKPNTEGTDFQPEYEHFKDMISVNLSLKSHKIDDFRTGDGNDLAENETFNSILLNDLIVQTNDDIISNENIILMSNIYGDYLTAFKDAMFTSGQQVKVISILRDPVNSFLMDESTGFTFDKDNEDNNIGIEFFSNLLFLYEYEHEVDIEYRYETIIDSGTIILDDTEIILNKTIKKINATGGLNDWEEENITPNKTLYTNDVIDIITTRFDSYVNKTGLIPKDIAGYLGYTY